MTRQDDSQWSSVVQWIVIATFYAEEKGISSDVSYEMPLVNLLGPYKGHGGDQSKDRDFSRMLRDAVLLGNYGELYERNLEDFIPRSGRNKLNNQDPPGPLWNPYLLF